MHDLIIRNARIIDGTGAPAFAGTLAIDGSTITAVHRAEDGDGAPTAGGPSVGGPIEARRVIDAGGRLLTPGFVDIHTHYDGQVCWDKALTPSCWHGVTTVVMGNCGVGFAPVRPGREGELVSLMESVEDIPGTALHEGVTWGWETFEQYLDAIDTPYVMDVGAQVPHVALRHYVMGERSYDDATPSDMAEMKRITRSALEAGALGFSTSRFYGHIDKAGRVVPGTNASAEEMMTIGSAFEGMPHGTIEIISDWLKDDEELRWIEHIARTTGRTITTLSVAAAAGGCTAGVDPHDARGHHQPDAAVPRLSRDPRPAAGAAHRRIAGPRVPRPCARRGTHPSAQSRRGEDDHRLPAHLPDGRRAQLRAGPGRQPRRDRRAQGLLARRGDDGRDGRRRAAARAVRQLSG
jgi:N-acyl-D-aspartate/D-glutamate deacylase